MNKQLHVTNRHYFLDWLRVIAFAVLIFYHNWHVVQRKLGLSL
ncbi:hypothetical protein PSH49_11965 [Pseudoalteromonas sp. GABNS16G]|nr:hypothetical protein [Pseudoalteromonas sp. GABNS16G]